MAGALPLLFNYPCDLTVLSSVPFTKVSSKLISVRVAWSHEFRLICLDLGRKNSLEPLHNLLALMVKKTNRQNLLRDVPSKLTSPSPGHPQHRTDRRAHTLHFPFYHHNHPVRQAGQVAFKSPLPVPSALFTAPEPRIGSRETLSTLGSTSLPGLPTPGFQDLWAAHAFKTLSPALHYSFPTQHVTVPHSLGNPVSPPGFITSFLPEPPAQVFKAASSILEPLI